MEVFVTMKKKVLLSALLMFTVVLCWGQQKEVRVRSVEFEMGGGAEVAFRRGEALSAMALKLELRTNLPESRWDVGFQVALGGPFDEGTPLVPGGGYGQSALLENLTYLLPVADYNFRRGRKISYFVGAGLGIALSRVDAEAIEEGGLGRISRAGVTVMPRGGVEFFNRLRVTVDYKWNWRAVYDYAGISLGIVFGGGKKR